MNDKLAIADRKPMTLVPTTMDEAMRYAQIMADTSLVPPQMRGKPGEVLIAVQYGIELGIAPLQAVQNIAVINNKATIYGDMLPALVRASGKAAFIEETFDRDTMTATCRTKRKDEEIIHEKSFSKKDAIDANLWNKSGPWSQYPERMLQMRARAFCLRDVYADVLKGLAVREEVADYQDYDVEVQIEEGTEAERAKSVLKKKVKETPQEAPEPRQEQSEPEPEETPDEPEIAPQNASEPPSDEEEPESAKIARARNVWIKMRGIGFEGEGSRNDAHNVISYLADRELSTMKDLTGEDVQVIMPILAVVEKEAKERGREFLLFCVENGIAIPDAASVKEALGSWGDKQDDTPPSLPLNPPDDDLPF